MQSIESAAKRRDWDKLPASFKRDAVNALRNQLRPSFKGNGSKLITARSALARAFDFDGLRRAVGLLGETL